MSFTKDALILIQQQQLQKQRGLVEFARAFVPFIRIDPTISQLAIGDFNLGFRKYTEHPGNVYAALYVGSEFVTHCKNVCLDVHPHYIRLFQNPGFGIFNIYVVEKTRFLAEIEIVGPIVEHRRTRVCFPIEYQAKVEEFFKAMCKAFNWEIKQG